MGNRSASATGGSGAGYDAIVYLEPGDYTIDVGKGGAGRGSYKNADSPGGDNAQATTLSKDGVVLVSAGGGTAGKTNQYGYDVGQRDVYAGKGGVLSVKNLKEYKVTIKRNGNNGTLRNTENTHTTQGAPGVFTNSSFGSSGDASGTPQGGIVQPSYNGYAKIDFMGFLPPNDNNSNNRELGLLYKDLQFYIKV